MAGACRKQHSVQLEANSFQNPADFLVMLVICGAALCVMGAFMAIPFLGMGLVFAIVYVWAKENAEQEVNFIFNLATFKVSAPAQYCRMWVPDPASRPLWRVYCRASGSIVCACARRRSTCRGPMSRSPS